MKRSATLSRPSFMSFGSMSTPPFAMAHTMRSMEYGHTRSVDWPMPDQPVSGSPTNSSG